MKLTDIWFTALAESEDGQMIVVSGRDNISDFRKSGKFRERAEVTWSYRSAINGMPSEEEAKKMEEVLLVLQRSMEKNKLAILTGVYTGAGERTWVFYTRNVPAFGQMLNDALADFERLPLSIYTEKDLEWAEYQEMYESKPEEGSDDFE